MTTATTKTKPKAEAKVSAKAAARPAPKAAFKKKEMEPYRRMLNELKVSLLKEVLLNEDASKESSEGDVLDLADQAADAYDKDIANSLSETERARLRAVEKALERVDKGSYGLCETCSKSIPLQRLKALPFARLCVPCQNDEERIGS